MYINQFNVVDDHVVEVKRVVVHKFRMSDVEDPDLYAAQPLMEWQESEMGKWVMERAVDTPEWHRHVDNMTYGYQYAITAKLKAKDYTFWELKWGTK
jgi:hypothetical protein